MIRKLVAGNLKVVKNPQVMKTLGSVEELNYHSYAYCVNGDIKGIGVLLIENKFIHDCGKVGHIVELNGDNNNVNSELIKFLCKLAHEQGCYKVILNCPEEQSQFYAEHGFVNKGAMMIIENKEV